MSKIDSFLLAILSLAAISCAADVADESPASGEEGLVPISFKTRNDSKTSLSGTAVLWESDDLLGVFDEKGLRCFVTSDSGETAVFHGSACPSDEFLAQYPYSSAASRDGYTIRTSVPTSQTATLSAFAKGANLSFGKVQQGSSFLQMKNAGALLCFTIPAESGETVRSVRIESVDGTPMSGIADFNLSGNNPEYSPVKGSCAYVKLEAASVMTSGEYYVCVLPGKHEEGFRALFTLSDGHCMILRGNNPLNLERNGIVDLGVIDLNSLEEDEAEQTVADPTSAFSSFGIDFKKLTNAGHPRLFMSADDFKELKKRVVASPDENDILYKFHKVTMARAERLYPGRSKRLTYDFKGTNNLLDVAHETFERLFLWSYAYKLTGETRFLARAKEDLSDVCAFPDWNSDHFLDCSEIATGVAIAYDWLYYDLTSAERAAAHQAMANFDLAPFKSYSVRVEGNWNQATCGGVISAATVLYEKEKTLCAKVFDKAVNKNLEAVRNMFYPNGNGLEGMGYWGYAVSFEGIIVSALENVFGNCCGITDIQGLDRSGGWALFMDGPTGGFNFSDTSSEELKSNIGLVFLSSYFDHPEYLVREKVVMQKDAIYSSSRFLPACPIWLFKNPFSHQDDSFPKEKVWSANDKGPIVLTRIGWKYDDTDRYVGLKAASGNSPHSHMDGGSFVYDALGERWACDFPHPGYLAYQRALQEAGQRNLFDRTQMSLRWDILIYNSFFHNTLGFLWSDSSVSKLHVSDQISERSGALVETYTDGEEGYGGKLNISELYADAAASVFRTARIVDSDLNIIDEITALSSHEAPFEWRMLTKAEAKVEDGYISLSQNGKQVFLYCKTAGEVSQAPVYAVEPIVRPSSWTARTWDSLDDYSNYRIVKFSSCVPAGRSGSFKTIISTSKPSSTSTGIDSEKPDFDDEDDAKY